MFVVGKVFISVTWRVGVETLVILLFVAGVERVDDAGALAAVSAVVSCHRENRVTMGTVRIVWRKLCLLVVDAAGSGKYLLRIMGSSADNLFQGFIRIRPHTAKQKGMRGNSVRFVYVCISTRLRAKRYQGRGEPLVKAIVHATVRPRSRQGKAMRHLLPEELRVRPVLEAFGRTGHPTRRTKALKAILIIILTTSMRATVHSPPKKEKN